MRTFFSAALLSSALVVPATADLESDVRSLLRSADLGDTVVAVSVAELTPRGPETLVDIQADRPLAPASNMKLLTTAAALEAFGPDHAFETRLSLVSPPGGGAPSLLVTGSGDPGFGDNRLLSETGLGPDDLVDRWVEAARATGQTRFAELRIDDSVFDREFVHPDWPADQLDKWYCAEVAGLNFNENCIDVLYAPGPTRNSPPVVKVFPLSPELAAVSRNRARTGDDDAFWVSRPRDGNAFTFRGTVKDTRVDPLHVTVHDPPMFFGGYLAHRLRDAGLEVGEVVRGTPPSGASVRPLHRVRTTLAGVLDRTNRNSQNLFAEALLKSLGHAKSGEPGSFASGSAAAKRFLQTALPDIDLSGVVVTDGSGLARTNRLTTRVLVGLLAHTAAASPEAAGLYRSSLAELGQSGTLLRRGGDVEASRVYAKTGYILQVSGLSGYLVFPARSGSGANTERVYAFSMLFNGFKPPLSNGSMKNVQDRILALLDERLARPTALSTSTPNR